MCILTCRELKIERKNEQGSITEPFTTVTGPAAWYAADYRNSDAYIYRLSSTDISELESAVAGVEESGAEIQVQFPLSTA